MSPMPRTFGSVGDTTLANYNFTDLASNTGMFKFYGGACINSATTTYILSNYIYLSQPVNTTGTMATGDTDWTKRIDVDFDLVLGKPLNLLGLAILNIPMYVGYASTTIHYHVIAKIRKYDGANEIEIANGQTSDLEAGDAALHEQQSAIKITIPLTHFKKGETLRLTLEGWCKNNGASGTGTIGLCHDPANRTTAPLDFTTNNSLIFECPTRIDI